MSRYDVIFRLSLYLNFDQHQISDQMVYNMLGLRKENLFTFSRGGLGPKIHHYGHQKEILKWLQSFKYFYFHKEKRKTIRQLDSKMDKIPDYFAK